MLRSPLSSIALAALAFACNDYGVTAQPAPDAPAVSIDPEQPKTEDMLHAVVDDAESNVTYAYTWFVDGRRVEDLDSDTVPPDLTAKGELWQVNITPFTGNLQGTPGRAEVEILNSPPELTASWAQPDPSPSEDLQVLTTTFDADEDTVSLTFSWSVDGIPLDHDAPDLSAHLTERGQLWQVTVTPNDGEEDGEPVTLTAEIGNTAPVVGGVTIGPDPAFTDTTLFAEAHDVFDEDGDEVTLTFDWFVDGARVQSSPDATLHEDLFAKHQEVYVEVTPFDGAAEGAPVRSDTLVISNTPPILNLVNIDPGEVYTTTTATCAPDTFIDPDGDPEDYRFSWQVNGSEAGTAATLPGSAFVRGDLLGCTATPFDGEDEGPSVDSPVIEVLNSPPVLSGVTLSPSSPRAGDTISAALGAASDADLDPVSFRYAWLIDGVETGHTGPTLSDFAQGNVVQVRVTPNDGIEDGAPVLSGTVTVDNTPPVIHGLTLAPRPAYTNTPVAATAIATDADGHELSYTFAWFVDGAEQGTTAAVLPSVAFEKGANVYAQVQVSDGIATVGPYTSEPLTISNSAPSTPPTPNLSPEDPETEDDLRCYIGSPSTDADGDPITYDVEFFRDGALHSAHSTSSLDLSLSATHTAPGQTWTCRFRARDDEGATSSWTSMSPPRTVPTGSIDYIDDRRTFTRSGAGWTGEGSGLAISEERGHLAVWDGYNSIIRVFNLATGSSTTHSLGGSGSGKGIDYTHDGRFLFAAGTSSAWLHKVDTATYTVVATSSSFGARGTDIRVISDDRFLIGNGNQLRLYDHDLNLLSVVSCPYAGFVSYDDLDSKVYVSGFGYNSGTGIARIDLNLATDTLTLDWQEHVSGGFAGVIPLYDEYLTFTVGGVARVHRKSDRALLRTYSYGAFSQTATARYSADTLAFIDTSGGSIYRYSETEGAPALIGSTPTPFTWANGFEVSPNFLSIYWNRTSPALEIFRITPM